MLGILSRQALSRTARYFARRRLAKIVTAAGFVVVILLLALGMYRFFRTGFSFMASDAYTVSALRLYVFEIFLLVVGALVFMSAAIATLLALFRGDANDWVMAAPRFFALPEAIALRVFVSSLWPFIVIAIPALFAVRTVFGYPLFAVALALLGIMILVALAVLLAFATLLATASVLHLIGRWTSRRFLTLGATSAAALGVIGIGGAIAWVRIATGDVLDLFRVAPTGVGVADVGAIRHAFQLFPTHLAAQALFDLGASSYASAFSSLGSLALLLAAVALASALLVKFFYLPVWQILQEGRFRAETAAEEPTARAVRGPTRFPRYFRSPTGAVFEKEGLALARSLRSTLWLGFMLALWMAQTALAVFLRANLLRHQASLAGIAQILETLFVVVTVYFMASFTLRFGFPAMSAERKTSWILGSSPLDLGRVYRAKFLFFTFLMGTIGLAVAIANAAILEFPLRDAGVFLTLVLTSVAFVTALGLALGAWFPNFETDDPELLSTSLPGLAFTALALAYGALGAYVLFDLLGGGSPIPFFLFELFSLSGIVTFYVLPPATLRTLEFGGTEA